MAANYGAKRKKGEQIMANGSEEREIPENIPLGAIAPGPAPDWQARQLLRAARVGTLATAKDGQPFASLVTPACAPDLSVLMLLSTLSEHTRQLRTEKRVSLMVTGEPVTANPQTAPRVTVTGLAELEPDPALKARWLAVHPYAQLYAGFGDFALWRIRPLAAQLVGGFARAFRLKQADLTPDPRAVAEILAAEADIIVHCNQDHAEALALIAGKPGAWRMVALDVDGCDLAPDRDDVAVQRVSWSAPVDDVVAVRKELVALTKTAREATSRR
jgi:putative heme iron utilization protein